MVSSSSASYPRPRRGGVGVVVGVNGKLSSSSTSQPLSLRDVEREVEDVFETHSVAEIREVRIWMVERSIALLFSFVVVVRCLSHPFRRLWRRIHRPLDTSRSPRCACEKDNARKDQQSCTQETIIDLTLHPLKSPSTKFRFFLFSTSDLFQTKTKNFINSSGRG